MTGPGNWHYYEAGLAWEWNPERAMPPALAEQVRAARLRPEVCNGFLPGDLRVVGPAQDRARQEAYLQAAFERAALFGVDMVVFGSGGARQIQESYSRETAWADLVSFTRLAGKEAARHGVRIVIEPLNSRECNLINNVGEALRLAEEVSLPSVGVLTDLYHLTMDGQSLDETRAAGDRLWHVHVAIGLERRAPEAGDEGELRPLFRTLKEIGYRGRVSVESGWRDFAAQSAGAYDTLRRAWDQA